jgi:hypothetical protein
MNLGSMSKTVAKSRRFTRGLNSFALMEMSIEQKSVTGALALSWGYKCQIMQQ